MPKLAINGGTPVRTEPAAPWPRATAADIEVVTAALEEGSWCRISGDRAHEFEQEFAAFQGARFGVAVNSGTSALELGLLALGIKPGDEVIMSPYTFMASASSVLVTRGVPVFVDIESDTYNIDPEAIEAAITDRTFAIMPVHFGGRACDMDRVVDVARNHGLRVIEDASHAHGATWDGTGLGTIGDVGAFSLGSGKNLRAGEAGILLTNSEDLYQRAAEGAAAAGLTRLRPVARRQTRGRPPNAPVREPKRDSCGSRPCSAIGSSWPCARRTSREARTARPVAPGRGRRSIQSGGALESFRRAAPVGCRLPRPALAPGHLERNRERPYTIGPVRRKNLAAASGVAIDVPPDAGVDSFGARRCAHRRSVGIAPPHLPPDIRNRHVKVLLRFGA